MLSVQVICDGCGTARIVDIGETGTRARRRLRREGWRPWPGGRDFCRSCVLCRAWMKTHEDHYPDVDPVTGDEAETEVLNEYESDLLRTHMLHQECESLRAIEEILGWRYCARCRRWIPPDLDGQPDLDGGTDHASRSVTVDDLVAWLGARVLDWRLWPTHNPPGRLILSTRKAGEFEAYHDGVTMRDVFAAAVRAVADE